MKASASLALVFPGDSPQIHGKRHSLLLPSNSKTKELASSAVMVGPGFGKTCSFVGAIEAVAAEVGSEVGV
jgi:hypothetical protein